MKTTLLQKILRSSALLALGIIFLSPLFYSLIDFDLVYTNRIGVTDCRVDISSARDECLKHIEGDPASSAVCEPYLLYLMDCDARDLQPTTAFLEGWMEAYKWESNWIHVKYAFQLERLWRNDSAEGPYHAFNALMNSVGSQKRITESRNSRLDFLFYFVRDLQERDQYRQTGSGNGWAPTAWKPIESRQQTLLYGAIVFATGLLLYFILLILRKPEVSAKSLTWKLISLPVVFIVFGLVFLLVPGLLIGKIIFHFSEEFLKNPYFIIVFGTVLMLLSCALLAWWAGNREALRWKSFTANWKRNLAVSILLPLIGLLGDLFFTEILQLAPDASHQVFLEELLHKFPSGKTGAFLFASLFLFPAAVFEELMFRNILLEQLRKMLPLTITVVVVSMLFALMHVSGPHTSFLLALFSLIFCGAYLWTKSVWTVSFGHYFYNLFLVGYLLFY